MGKTSLCKHIFNLYLPNKPVCLVFFFNDTLSLFFFPAISYHQYSYADAFKGDSDASIDDDVWIKGDFFEHV